MTPAPQILWPYSRAFPRPLAIQARERAIRAPWRGMKIADSRVLTGFRTLLSAIIRPPLLMPGMCRYVPRGRYRSGTHSWYPLLASRMKQQGPALGIPRIPQQTLTFQVPQGLPQHYGEDSGRPRPGRPRPAARTRPSAPPAPGSPGRPHPVDRGL